jgi:hypothetical protein
MILTNCISLPRFLATHALVGILVLAVTLFPKRAMAQDNSNDCKAIPKQINDLVDKLPEVSERIGKVTGQIEEADRALQRTDLEAATRQKWVETRNSLQHTLETEKSTIRKIKVNIDSLLDKLCACCAKKPEDTAMTQDSSNDCKAIPKQINDLVDKLPEVSERIGKVTGQIEEADRALQRRDLEAATRQKWVETRNSLQHTLETEKSTIRKIKVNIDSLLDKLCACCAKKPQQTKVIEKKKEACDIEFGYDYMRAPDESAKNLNGFGGSLFCNVKPWIAIGGDFGALFGSTTDTVGTTKIYVSLHRQTYLFGPQFNFYPNDKVKVFVHPLFGGVHDATKITIGSTTTVSSANAFAMSFGGGVDVNLSNRFAVRPIQFDFVPTRFGGAWQSNYQISTGVVIHFGEKK